MFYKNNNLFEKKKNLFKP